MTSLRDRDPFDVRLALEAPEPLRAFNDAGVLSVADVQVARRLAALGDVEHPAVLLALALAVRAPRLGHVLVDLSTIRTTVAVDTEEPIDLDALPWPDTNAWVAAVGTCDLVAVGDEEVAPARPLRLVGSELYLDRYWRDERQVAADIRARAATSPAGFDAVPPRERVERLSRLAPGDSLQRRATATAVSRRFAVVAGGPGTGKTTTVAQIAALVTEQALADGGPAPLIALAAPTGKAAARLEEQVHRRAPEIDTTPEVRERLTALRASTLHRLLGWRPGSHSRFRHDRDGRLPHDMVIVDEASMVSLTLMARLLEAVRPDAGLVLVGDPHQLASIEAGAVLGDIVGARRPGDGIEILEKVHRYGPAIGAVADAVRQGDPDALFEALTASPGEVTWIPVDVGCPDTATAASLLPTDTASPDVGQLAVGAPSDPPAHPGHAGQLAIGAPFDPPPHGGHADVDAALAPVRDAAVAAGQAVIAAAAAGDGRAALDALGAFRLLCAHRRGPYGVSTWMPRVEGWLDPDIAAAGAWGRDYLGRPLLITANDYDLDLFNGDTGVEIADGAGGITAVFERRNQLVRVRPNRLRAAETVHAMTVHKSQGSQFGTAAVVVPPPTSRILTRELLYTAVTRARHHLIVVGTEQALRAAVTRPASRSSALATRLKS